MAHGYIYEQKLARGQISVLFSNTLYKKVSKKANTMWLTIFKNLASNIYMNIYTTHTNPYLKFYSVHSF